METSTRERAVIRVKVLFFGAARDAAQQGEFEITFSDGATSSDALTKLIERFPDLRRFGASLLFAVNQEYAREPRELKDGDELALFPPVSGGAAQIGANPASA